MLGNWEISEELHNKSSHEFFIDILVNVVGLCAVNSLIFLIFYAVGRWYGADVLGGLNICFAILIFFGQVASCGVQSAVLYYLPSLSPTSHSARQILTSALSIVFFSAFFMSFAVWLCRDFFLWAFNSDNVHEMMLFVTPALFFFVLNKILFNSICGIQRMKAFAIFQAMRFLLMFFCVAVLIYCGVKRCYLGSIFLVSEGVVCLSMIFYVWGIFRFSLADFSFTWLKKLLSFGLYSLPAGAMQELNTRVDVIMLGLFYADQYVGIYSFAAILIEVLLQVAFAVRRNIDPIIARLHFAENTMELRKLIKGCVQTGVVLWSFIAIVSCLAYLPLLELAGVYEQYHESREFFIILICGALVWGSVIPVSGILLQIGQPKLQTLLLLCSVGINILLNAVLVPLAGGNGAAVATAFSFIITSVLLFYFLKNILKR